MQSQFNFFSHLIFHEPLRLFFWLLPLADTTDYPTVGSFCVIKHLHVPIATFINHFLFSSGLTAPSTLPIYPESLLCAFPNQLILLSKPSDTLPSSPSPSLLLPMQISASYTTIPVFMCLHLKYYS